MGNAEYMGDRDQGKDREKDKDKEKTRDRDKGRDRDKEKQRERSKENHKEYERIKECEKDVDRGSHSSPSGSGDRDLSSHSRCSCSSSSSGSSSSSSSSKGQRIWPIVVASNSRTFTHLPPMMELQNVGVDPQPPEATSVPPSANASGVGAAVGATVRPPAAGVYRPGQTCLPWKNNLCLVDHWYKHRRCLGWVSRLRC